MPPMALSIFTLHFNIMSVFRFKQFELKQSEQVFKIGTDAVLLGAWAHASANENPQNILDVGCGTGIVSLMLAQRYPQSNVCAIDIHQEASATCFENFQSSPFKQRLDVHNSSLASFKSSKKFDLIVSNPPYFSQSTLSQQSHNQLARHTLHLNATTFFNDVTKLSKPTSSICLIIPTLSLNEWLDAGRILGFTPRKTCRIRTRKNSKVVRSLVLFSISGGTLIETEVVIRNEDGSFSDVYTDLTRIFHPFMD